jgi:hypothetical protein
MGFDVWWNEAQKIKVPCGLNVQDVLEALEDRLILSLYRTESRSWFCQRLSGLSDLGTSSEFPIHEYVWSPRTLSNVLFSQGISF